jgi:hypothetical protein
MNTLPLILNAITLTTTTITTLYDYKLSKKDPYHALTEANPLWKDKYGFFNPKKALIPTILILIILASLSFIPTINQWAFCTYLPITITELLVIQRKLKNQKAQRKRQINTLNYLLNPNTDTTTTLLATTTTNSRIYLSLFPWINGNPSTTPIELQSSLISQINHQQPEEYLAAVERSGAYRP